MALNGGKLNGAGQITGSVASAGGEVAPGTASTTGVINLTGDYSETSASKLTIKIAGLVAGQFDQLNVTGNTTLAGTFNGSFIGGYTPALGTTVWSVLTYASHTGAFTTVNPPTYARGTVTSAYKPTSFDLTAVTPASADLKLVMNGPATVNAAAPLSYTIDVSNLGPDATSGLVTVADTLPAGATGASGSGTGWSCGAPSGGIITCTTLTSGNALPTLTISMTAPVASSNVTRQRHRLELRLRSGRHQQLGQRRHERRPSGEPGHHQSQCWRDAGQSRPELLLHHRRHQQRPVDGDRTGRH